MKAISLMEPFATLVIMGIKTIETRVKTSPVAKMKHSDELLICTSMRVHSLFKEIYRDPFFKEAMIYLYKLNKNYTPVFGKAIGIFTPGNICEFTPEKQHQACCMWYPSSTAIEGVNPKPIIPFAVKGKLGLFDVDVDLEDLKFIS